SSQELAAAIHQEYDPELVKAQRESLYQQLATALKDQWSELYRQLPIQAYEDRAEARGNRALRNVALDMALTANVIGADEWAEQQYDNASCMTERFGALKAMVNHQLANA